MPLITGHAPKVYTRSIYPYARDSSRKKLQQDRHTHRDTDGLSKTLFSRRFEGCTSQIRSYVEVDFLHDAKSMGHGSKTDLS